MLTTQQFSEQARNRPVAEAAVDAAGHVTSGFHSNQGLEIYFDISMAEREVAFIANLLDDVIYSVGFNAETLREALATLIQCTERVEQDLRCRVGGALFGSVTSTRNQPLPA